MEPISINDELQLLKKEFHQVNKRVIKIEKIGNGNMAAFSVTYIDNNNPNMEKTQFFWRHDLDSFIQKVRNSNNSHH